MTPKRFISTACVTLAMMFSWHGAPTARGQWISEGDYFVTVTDTPLMDRSTKVTTFEAGTNLRAHGAQGSWVGVKQKVAGQDVSGWVKRSDLLKIGKNQRAIYAKHSTLIRSQGRALKLPKDLPVNVTYASDYSLDIFVISDEGIASYKWVMEHDSGQVASYYKKWNTRNGTFAWRPPDDRQYYLLIDNTDFPDKGANSRRTIHCSLAYCIEDPKPSGPRYGRGLIIGRATLDFDGHKGRYERCTAPFKVVLKKTDTDENSETLSASVGTDGYFFIENVDRKCSYSVQKLDGSNFEAPVTVGCTSSFSGRTSAGPLSVSPTKTASKKDDHVLDVGCFALRVNSKDKVFTSVDAPEFTASTYKDGDDTRTRIQFNNDTPLDRHAWFLEKFPENGWAAKVKADRDEIIKNREEKTKDEKTPPAPSVRAGSEPEQFVVMRRSAKPPRRKHIT